MAHVINVNKGKESRIVLLQLERWEELKGKDRTVIARRMMIRILNGIWKAHTREQDQMFATIFADTESHPATPTALANDVTEAAESLFPFIRDCGYDPRISGLKDHFCYYRSSRSTSGEFIHRRFVNVKWQVAGNLQAIKQLWSELNAKLPKSEKRVPYKKKEYAQAA